MMLINNISTIARRLQDEFKNTSAIISHSGVKGTFREDSLKKYLREIVPNKYSIGTGIVVDANEKQSRQQDFLLYDAFSSPSFLKGETDVVIPVESVYGTIEIKSTLTKESLLQSIENARSVKTLYMNLLKSNAFQLTGTNYIYSSIFAYTTDTSLETITENFRTATSDIPLDERVSTICILDKGIILNANETDLRIISTRPTESTSLIIKPNILEQNLYLFYLLLQSHLSLTYNYPPDLMKYATLNGSLKDGQTIIPKKSVSDAMVLPFGNYKMSGHDFIRFTRIQPLIYKAMINTLKGTDIQESGYTPEQFMDEVKWGIEIQRKMMNPVFNCDDANDEPVN